jgi:sulfur carrier protein
MTIFVNDKPVNFDKEQYIEDIISELNVKDKKGIAVAVNYQVISKDKWNQYPLKDQDKVTIIKATAGG